MIELIERAQSPGRRLCEEVKEGDGEVTKRNKEPKAVDESQTSPQGIGPLDWGTTSPLFNPFAPATGGQGGTKVMTTSKDGMSEVINPDSPSPNITIDTLWLTPRQIWYIPALGPPRLDSTIHLGIVNGDTIYIKK